MNVRALAPSSGGKQSSKGASQADRGRARQSWSGKGVSFEGASSSYESGSPALNHLSADASSSMAGGGACGGGTLLAGFPTDVEDAVTAQMSAQSAFEEIAQEDDSIGTEGRDCIPGWQNDLLDVYEALGGAQWKDQGGWPTAAVMPRAQALPTLEIYGVQRPFNRLHEVTVVDLAWNGLKGEVATCRGLWNLRSLEVLHLGSNRLSGPLPGYEVRNLGMLRELHMYRNALDGKIPADLGECRQLTSLWLFENHLTGALPERLFGDLTALVDLRLNSNRLTGRIPPSVGKCRHLKTLNLQKNGLEGGVPDDIYTGCVKLRDLRLWSNRLTGPLSPEVSCLKQLECLMVQSNLLSWMIPSTLGKCSQLVKLDLSKNNFRGELPFQTFGPLQNLGLLNVSSNPRVSGVLPHEIKQLRSLTSVDLSSTALEELDQFVLDMKQSLPQCRVTIEGFGAVKLL